MGILCALTLINKRICWVHIHQGMWNSYLIPNQRTRVQHWYFTNLDDLANINSIEVFQYRGASKDLFYVVSHRVYDIVIFDEGKQNN